MEGFSTAAVENCSIAIHNCKKCSQSFGVSYYDYTVGVPSSANGAFLLTNKKFGGKQTDSSRLCLSRTNRISSKYALVGEKNETITEFIDNPEISQSIEKIFSMGFEDIHLSRKYLMASMRGVKKIQLDISQINELINALRRISDNIPQSLTESYVDLARESGGLRWDIAIPFMFISTFLLGILAQYLYISESSLKFSNNLIYGATAGISLSVYLALFGNQLAKGYRITAQPIVWLFTLPFIIVPAWMISITLLRLVNENIDTTSQQIEAKIISQEADKEDSEYILAKIAIDNSATIFLIRKNKRILAGRKTVSVDYHKGLLGTPWINNIR